MESESDQFIVIKTEKPEEEKYTVSWSDTNSRSDEKSSLVNDCKPHGSDLIKDSWYDTSPPEIANKEDKSCSSPCSPSDVGSTVSASCYSSPVTSTEKLCYVFRTEDKSETGGVDRHDGNTLIYEAEGDSDEQFAIYLNKDEDDCMDEDCEDCTDIKMEVNSSSPHPDGDTVNKIIELSYLTASLQETGQYADDNTEDYSVVERDSSSDRTRSEIVSNYQVHPCVLVGNQTSNREHIEMQTDSNVDTDYGLEGADIPRDTLNKTHQLICPDCGEGFQSVQGFKKHMEREIQKVKVTCADCNKDIVFQNKCQVGNHIRKHLEHKDASKTDGKSCKLPQLSYGCKSCTVIFSSAKRFDRHLHDQADEKQPKIWICTLCEERLFVQNKCKIYQHIANHKRPIDVMEQVLMNNIHKEKSGDAANRTVSSQMPQAPSTPTTNTSMPIANTSTPTEIPNKSKDKKTKKKQQQQRYKGPQCLVCLGIFGFKSTLENHLSKSTYCNPEYSCKECSLILPSACAFIAHGSMHGDPAQLQKPYMCPECGKTFCDSWSLYAQHVLYQCLHGNRVCVLKCSICSKIMNHTAKLTLHMESHIVEFVQCRLCGKAFNHTRTLSVHMKMVHSTQTIDETYDVRTTCLHCSEIFSSNFEEKKHIKFHVNEAVKKASFGFKCLECKQESTFSTKVKLSDHRTQMHTNPSEKFCHTCKKEFTSVKRLCNHVKRFHKPLREVHGTPSLKSVGMSEPSIEIDVAEDQTLLDNEENTVESICKTIMLDRQGEKSLDKNYDICSGKTLDLKRETEDGMISISSSELKKMPLPGSNSPHSHLQLSSPQYITVQPTDISVDMNFNKGSQATDSVFEQSGDHSLDLNKNQSPIGAFSPKTIVVRPTDFKKIMDQMASEVTKATLVQSRDTSNELDMSREAESRATGSVVMPPLNASSDFDMKRDQISCIVDGSPVNASVDTAVKAHIRVMLDNTTSPEVKAIKILPKHAKSVKGRVQGGPPRTSTDVAAKKPVLIGMRKPIPILPKSEVSPSIEVVKHPLVHTSLTDALKHGSKHILNLKNSNHETRTYHCVHCEALFLSALALKQHMFSKEQVKATPLYTCITCNMILPNNCALHLHEKLHSDKHKIPAACPECGLVFSNDWAAFMRHVTMECCHHRRVYCVKCAHCDKAIPAATFLSHFYQYHLPYWILSVDKCMFCRRRKHHFDSKDVLKSHYEFHASRLTMRDVIFQFCCVTCRPNSQPELFNDVEDLWEHITAVHGGIRTYTCLHCPLKFPFVESLEAHVASNHPQSAGTEKQVSEETSAGFISKTKRKPPETGAERNERSVETELVDDAPESEESFSKTVIESESDIEKKSQNEPEASLLDYEDLSTHVKLGITENSVKHCDMEHISKPVLRVCLHRVFDGTNYFCSFCIKKEIHQKYASTKTLMLHLQEYHYQEIKLEGTNVSRHKHKKEKIQDGAGHVVCQPTSSECRGLHAMSEEGEDNFSNFQREETELGSITLSSDGSLQDKISEGLSQAVGTDDTEDECPECGDAYRNACVLSKHSNGHCSKSQSFICEFCECSCVSVAGLGQHIAYYCPKGNNLKCPYCFLEDFNLKNELEQHLHREHFLQLESSFVSHQKRDNKASSDVGEESRTEPSKMRTLPPKMTVCPPLQKVGDKPVAHSCEFCGFTCTSRSHLLYHVSEFHSGFLPILICPFCNKRNAETAFGSIQMLRRHLSSQHWTGDGESDPDSETERHLCGIPENDSSSIISISSKTAGCGELTSVSERVNVTDKITCGICDRKYTAWRPGLLIKHMKLKHGKICCQVCNDEFDTTAELDEHCVVKHGQDASTVVAMSGRTKTKYKYRQSTQKCTLDMCPVSEDSKTVQFSQKKTQSEYLCSICSKTFTKSFILRRHLQRDHDIYLCMYCPIWYDSKDKIDVHITRKHSDRITQLFCYVCKARGELKIFYNRQWLEKHLQTHHKYPAENDNTKYDGMVQVTSPSSSSTVPSADNKSPSPQPESISLYSLSPDSSTDSKLPSPPPSKKQRLEKHSLNTCAKCSLVTDDASKFAEHIKEHNTDKASQCPECGLCFSILPALKKHLFMVHKIRDSNKYLQDKGMKTEEEEIDFDVMMDPFIAMHK